MKAVVYGASKYVYDDVIPSIKSLLMNSNVDKIYILAEDDELPFYLPEECKVINVSKQSWFRKSDVNYSSQWSYIILLRSVYAEIFPELDRVLVLDNDTIVHKDISELWDIDMSDYYFAAIKEFWKSSEDYLYTCIGVSLHNLDLLRSDDIYKKIMLEIKNVRYSFPEQDAFNKICQGHILELPEEYGASPWIVELDEPKIEHFAAVKGKWRKYHIVNYYRNIPWKTIEERRKNNERCKRSEV